jgi:hypothetical protein
MNNRKKIEEELKGLESSLPGENPAPYSVPDGYFENLASQVMSRLNSPNTSAAEEIASLSPLLAGISRQVPYAVPQDYFDQNLENLPLVTSEDPRSAILELAEGITPYQVPYNYFEELPANILNAVRPDPAVIKMKRSWMRMAVAAVFFGIIMVSGFWIVDNQKDKPVTVASQLKNVSNQELDEFIKSSSALVGSETVQNQNATIEVKELLNDVGDKELENFLNEVPVEDLYSLN